MKERMTELEPKIGGEMLIIGGNGFVGSQAREFLDNNFKLDVPGSSDLNITNTQEVSEYISKSQSKVVWLNAANTEVKKLSEDEKIDPAGPSWQINVNGVINVAEACYQFNKFLVLTSTGYVFEDGNGPYSEDTLLPTNIRNLHSEYAITKMIGEREAMRINPGKTAIVRIDYPFGNPKSERDYLQKIITLMQKGYPIMSDQVVTPTYLPDLTNVIDKISQKKVSGIFHVACSETSPYDLALMINENLGNPYQVKKGNVSEYIEKFGVPAWPIKSGISTQKTQKALDIKFTNLEKAVDIALKLIQV